ncbi:MAG TPA: NAD(P)-dependent oxidoreductase [Stellaceae bacterium]|nr:NAD(P)-dependent oxidoreductase [Stellaceae bacterium]
MLPITLNPAKIAILLIGDGPAADRRAAMLGDAGIREIRRLAPGSIPEAADLDGVRLVFIADRHAPDSDAIAARSRAAGALVHIEDDPARSDLHMPAVLRRGDLAIAISTGGASPALAARLKRALAELFGPEWQGRTAELAALRRDWRASGADAATLKRRTEDLIERRRWLPRLSSHSQNNAQIEEEQQ